MDITMLPGYSEERAAQAMNEYEAENWAGRLRAAGEALGAFIAATRDGDIPRSAPADLVFPGSPADGLGLEVLGDLICDLLHVATINGVDPDDVFSQALRHHTAETGGDDLSSSIFAYLVHAGIAS